tara:strand:- start:568 stop:783 length:216 start_codon:yes stop_codon:yes gene_type:complete
MIALTAKDLLKEIENELGGKLTPHQRIIGGREIYKKYGFNCRIAPEQIEEATETIIKAIFNNFYNQLRGKN